jgi:hypothetical protein
MSRAVISIENPEGDLVELGRVSGDKRDLYLVTGNNIVVHAQHGRFRNWVTLYLGDQGLDGLYTLRASTQGQLEAGRRQEVCYRDTRFVIDHSV